MHCSIKLTWNGTTVLSGECTAATGIETARAFIANNFVGPNASEQVRLFDASMPLARLMHGGFVALDYADETGQANAVVQRKVAAK